MSGIGIIGQALGAGLAAGISGAGEGMSQGITEQMKEDARVKEIQAMQDAEILKQQAVAKYTYDLQNAPAQRAQGYLTDASTAQVPVTAQPVTSLTSGDPGTGYMNPDGSQATDAIKGDYATIRARLSTIQDPDQRAAALDTLDQQRAGEQASADSAIAGQARNPTAQETMAAAYAAAIGKGDIQSAAAIKQMMTDKFTVLPDGGTLIDTTTGQPVYSTTSKEDRKDARQEVAEAGKEERLNKLLARQKTEPEFIQELKTLYQPGSPEYAAALKARVDHQSGAIDSSVVEANAKAIAAGQQDPPNLNSRSPQNAAIMKRVYEINPDYSKRLQVAAQKSANSFASGPDGQTVSSFNATADHLTMLKEAADALKNGNIQAFNQIGNAYGKATGKAAPTNMEAVSQLVAGEIVKAVTAGNGALGDREGLEKKLETKLGPDQISGTIDAYNGMIGAQINAKYQKYNANIPAYVNNPELSDFARFLTPKVRAMTGISPPAGSTANWGTTTKGSDTTASPAVSVMPADIVNLVNKYGK